MPKSYYEITGFFVSLETPLPEVNDFCDYMWQEFLSVRRDVPYAEIRLEQSKQDPNSFSIYKEGRLAYDWGHELDAVPYQVLTKALENIVSGHAINQLDKTELISLHAGAVSVGGKGILILGESGNGKSTLTLELVVNQACKYLTDEVGLVAPDLQIHPFLKTVSYKRECVVQMKEQWEMRKFGIDHQVAVPAVRHGAEVPLEAVFYVKYAPENKPELVPMKKTESLVRLMNSQIGRAKSVASVEQMAELVKSADSYQINHNDVTKAASLVTELVNSL